VLHLLRGGGGRDELGQALLHSLQWMRDRNG
jgi:hypothetical protein